MGSANVYRRNLQCVCATCGAEWFGPTGEAAARTHASDTEHQVNLQILIKETINLVAEGAEPQYAPQVTLSTEELDLSRAAARERVSLFEQPLGRSGPGQLLNQRAVR